MLPSLPTAVRAALTGALLTGLLAPVWGVSHASAAGPSAGARPCADALLDRPQPAAHAVPRLSAAQQRHVAALNDLSLSTLHAVAGDGPAGDDTLWLDRCGHSFYMDPRDPAAGASAGLLAGLTATPEPAAGDTGPAGPLASTFSLQSNPTSTHTIYLDFDGQTVTGSAWNDPAYGSGAAPSITAAPYSNDGTVDTGFSASELTQIQRAWLVVAEDYAPYDVNVTTQDPGTAALERSGSTDTRYGVRVVITAHGPIYDYCHCGGLAYVGVYGDATANAYQPAWVFTDGTTTDGVALAQAVSHEVGHTIGLHHDGTTSTSGDSYYTGSGVWAPIMGASYYAPLTQWSKGEYPLANNQEDDVAIIGRVLGRRPDDRTNGLAGAESLPDDASSQRDGVIGTRTDVDAFRLTTGQQTTIAAHPTGYQPDLDLSLTISDATTGRVVAKVDPASAKGRGVAADGLGADYTLAAGPVRSYLISIDGVGNGSPSVAGHYSDYGSEGAYRLTVVPGSPRPLGVAHSSVTLEGRVGTAWSSGTAFAATGGMTPYSWSAGTLPPGAALDSATGALRGAVSATGWWQGVVTVTDATGATATITATFVARPPATTTTATGTSTPTTTPTVTAPRWRTVRLRHARIGRSYRGTLTVTGGQGALRWGLVGKLPPGIRLTVTDTGHRLVLAGKGRRPGRWRVTLHGRDRAGRALARTMTLAVRR